MSYAGRIPGSRHGRGLAPNGWRCNGGVSGDDRSRGFPRADGTEAALCHELGESERGNCAKTDSASRRFLPYPLKGIFPAAQVSAINACRAVTCRHLYIQPLPTDGRSSDRRRPACARMVLACLRQCRQARRRQSGLLLGPCQPPAARRSCLTCQRLHLGAAWAYRHACGTTVDPSTARFSRPTPRRQASVQLFQADAARPLPVR